jgi:hypothetical protein
MEQAPEKKDDTYLMTNGRRDQELAAYYEE